MAWTWTWKPSRSSLAACRFRASGPTNDALRALADAGVSVLFFELEGARLSDAFLAMTEAA